MDIKEGDVWSHRCDQINRYNLAQLALALVGAVTIIVATGGSAVGFALAFFFLAVGASLPGASGLDPCDPVSPLILDLDADGVEADAIAYFDHGGDGWSELSRWASEDDGVLVWDRNGDGIINDGSELFGNNTVLENGKKAADGFAALSELDSNVDGVVDASDEEWGSLRVMRWSDANDDGVMQEDESRLVTLSSLGVKSLGTAYSESDHIDKSGNAHRQVGSYTKTDGSAAKMTDVWFLTSPDNTTYDDSDIPEHSKAIKALPDLAGRGRLYSLRDAMALDDAKDADGNSRLGTPYYEGKRTEKRSLREMVEAFVETDEDGAPVLSKAQRTALADKILLRWAGAEGVSARTYADFYSTTTAKMQYTTAEKMAVAEAVQGEMWLEGKGYRNPTYKTAQKVNRGYLNYRERLYGELMLASHLKDLQAAMTIRKKKGVAEDSTSADDYELDFSGMEKLLTAEDDARRGELLRSLAALYGNSETVIAAMKSTASDWVYEYQYYAEYLERGVFDGNTLRQNDFTGDCGCSGGLRDNVFQTVDGGADTLRGRGGDDTYHLGIGTGHDRIEEIWRDSDWKGDDGDVIKVAPGIGKDRVVLSRTRDDLIVSLLDGKGKVTDSLTVAGHYADSTARVEKVLFEDGTEWGTAEFDKAVLSSGQGSAGKDTFDLTLDSKDATAYGGKGSDVYLLGRGSGNDTIDEARYNLVSSADVDVVRLKAGLSAADVRLTRSGYDLIIQVLSADGESVSNTLTVKGHYASVVAQIERVELSNGKLLWDKAALAGAVRSSGQGSAGKDIFDMTPDGKDATAYGGKGSDVYLLGRGSGNDTIDEARYNLVSSTDVDVVRLKSGLSAADVRLTRSRDDLIIQVLSADGESVSNTLTVKGHYAFVAAQIERVELSNGKLLWDKAALAGAVLADAGAGDDTVAGLFGKDVLSGGNGGNDTLRGGGGGDVYLFGKGSGHDVVDEGYQNFGSKGDVVRLSAGLTATDVSLSRDKYDLIISVKDAQGNVTDSLTVKDYYVSVAARIERVELSGGKLLWGASDFAGVAWTPPSYVDSTGEIVGSSGDDQLFGLAEMNDVFDSDAGGDDALYGYGGDDVYMLGRGTGHDRVAEWYKNAQGDAGDRVKLKSGIAAKDVRLVRSGDGKHLHIELLDVKGVVTDSMKIDSYYTDASARVEVLEFADGTSWGANEFAVVAIRGGSGDDQLFGLAETNDVFDSDAGGNDALYGYGGDDVYMLGRGTGHDRVAEWYKNAQGDAGDKVKLKSGIAAKDVRLVRSGDGKHLHIELLDVKGVVTDSMKIDSYYTDASARVEVLEFADGTSWGANEFAVVAIRGGSGDDQLFGLAETNDVFDSDAGGNDALYGYGGDDVYMLGRGTGHDRVAESYRNAQGDAGDRVKLKSGIAAKDVRLVRSGDGKHLHIELLDGKGVVTDSMKIDSYYTDASARVEVLEFADGTSWGANEFAVVAIRGGSGDDQLFGLAEMNDVFDSDAGGNDALYGYGGDDVYMLGRGTGHDRVAEWYKNAQGDAGDKVKLKSGIAAKDVRLVRSGDGKHLHIELLDVKGVVTDSMKIDSYYTDASARVEVLEFADGTSWGANEFAVVAIRGGSGDDQLFGLAETNDVFDSDAGGNDALYGYGGDDVYMLGRGTGHDRVAEWYKNAQGDAGDKVKLKSGIAAKDVRLVRSGDGKHLHIELLDVKGVVTDSMKIDSYYTDASARVEVLEFADGTSWGANEFAVVAIRGGSGDDQLFGLAEMNDVFDSDAGGDDALYGYGGDDVYMLGRGTGHDRVAEWYKNAQGDAGDRVKLKSGIAAKDVRLVRSGDGKHLHIELLDVKGVVTDSMKIDSYYTDASARVEVLEFADGTSWGANEFAVVAIRGGSGDDQLFGLAETNDVFDSDAGGNDALYGYGGDDVYMLGRGTGHDRVAEWYKNAQGDAGDKIKVKSGFGITDLNLWRSGNDLVVQLLDDDGEGIDSLRISNQYAKDAAKVESIELGNKVLREKDYQRLIDAIAVFTAGNSSHDTLAAVHSEYWEDITTPSA